MTENITKTFGFTVTREHAPHIIAPFNVTTGRYSEAPSRERYSIRIPAMEDFPGCRARDKDDGLGSMVAASCSSRPIIVVGENDEPLDRDYWDFMVARAHDWKYPVNRLLYGRDITIAVRMINVTNQYVKNQDMPWIIAVRIHGDLDSFRKDAGLEAHIEEIRGMLG